MQLSAEQQFQQLGDSIKAAHDECDAKFQSGKFKTFVAFQKCYNTFDYKIYKGIFSPSNMDLVDLLFAKFINIAKKLDQKKITLEEASVEDHEARSQFQTALQRRDALTPQSQAVVPQPNSPQGGDPFSCQNMLNGLINLPGYDDATKGAVLEQIMKTCHH